MSDTPVVRDNAAESRFEIALSEGTAFLSYERQGSAFVLVHTEVPPQFRGHHLGDLLVQTAVESARAQGLRLVVVCPFARAYLRKHPAPPPSSS